MDKISKALKKLPKKEYEWAKEIFRRLDKNLLSGLDVKKLKGTGNVFRIRKGGLRIIYQKIGNRNILIELERRSDTTYKNF